MFNIDVSGNGVGREAFSQFWNLIGAVGHHVGAGSVGFPENSQYFGIRKGRQLSGGDYVDRSRRNSTGFGCIES